MALEGLPMKGGDMLTFEKSSCFKIESPPPVIRNKARTPYFITLFNIILEVLVREFRQEKYIKVIYIRN